MTEPTRALDRLHVMLIEDDEDHAALVSRYLGEADVAASLTIAATLEEAKAIWARWQAEHEGVDLGSRNGSRVDGWRVSGEAPVPLVDGSVLRLGDVLLE